jgi:acyl carrier protein
MKIEAQIREYVSQNILFGDDTIEYGDDDSFLEEGIIDSVGIMELMLFVEQRFGITISDNEVTPENFDSVNKLSTYIRFKTNSSRY